MKVNPIEFDKKKTHTDKGHIRIFTALGIVSAAAAFIVLLAHAADREAATKAFAILFYPILLTVAAGLALGTGELIRNRYLSAVIAVSLNVCALLLTVAYIITQAILFDTVYILPFSSPF